MRFPDEGTYEVEIIEAAITDCKFKTPPPAFDVALKVRDEAGHEDWWHGEVSRTYGKGNFADRTQAQITLDVLREIGYQHGQDFSKLDTLVGMKTLATVEGSVSKSDGKTYYNVRYIGNGGSKSVVPLAPEELKARVAALFGDATNPAGQTGTPATGASPANPFGAGAVATAAASACPAPAANPFAPKK
jgi:hypothetical protein